MTEKVKFYLLYEGNPKPKIIEADVDSKYQMGMLLIGYLSIADENSIVADYIFGYYNGHWCYAIPDSEYSVNGEIEHEDIEG